LDGRGLQSKDLSTSDPFTSPPQNKKPTGQLLSGGGFVNSWAGFRFYSSSLPMPEDAQVHMQQQQPRQQHLQQIRTIWQHFFIGEKRTPVARQWQ
jgi:hypothetical protein